MGKHTSILTDHEVREVGPVAKGMKRLVAVEQNWFASHDIAAIGLSCPRFFPTPFPDHRICISYKGVLAEGTPIGNLTFLTGPETVTHEIGHTYGFDESYQLDQEGFCAASTRPAAGYWVSEHREVPAINHQAFDFMGCGNEEFWISTDHYNRLLDCLKAGAICAGGNIIIDPEILLLSGVFLKNGSMILGPAYDIPTGIPEVQHPGSGNFTLSSLARDGSVLSSTDFELDFNQVREGSKVQLEAIPFDISIPLLNNTWTIQIVHDGEVIAVANPFSKSLHDAVAVLPDKAFDKNPNQRRSALLNKIDAFDKMLTGNDINGALQKLQNDIKPHVQEWTVDYPKDNSLQLSKPQILQLIDRIIARLSAQSGTTQTNQQVGSGLGIKDFGSQLSCRLLCFESLNNIRSNLVDRIHIILRVILDGLQQVSQEI